VCLCCNYVKTEKGGKILRFRLTAKCQIANMLIFDKLFFCVNHWITIALQLLGCSVPEVEVM